MSWLYSRALVEEFSEDISLDGEPCALWNGTPTRPPSWCNDRTMVACRLSRSGTTFKLLTDDHGEAVLMSYLEAFPARTSAAPVREQESTENDPVCGDTWRELLVKYDPDSSSWKTAQCLWEEDLPESSLTLPRWGMTVGGQCWERITLPPLTSGTESGSWPTPSARDWKDSPGMSKEGVNPDGSVRRRDDQLARKVYAAENTQTGGMLNPDWVEWLMGWPIGWTALNASGMDKSLSVRL